MTSADIEQHLRHDTCGHLHIKVDDFSVAVARRFDGERVENVGHHKENRGLGEEPTRTNSRGADMWVERRMRRPV